jgi:hypothetical protein
LFVFKEGSFGKEASFGLKEARERPSTGVMVLARRAAIAVPTVNARIPKLTVLERERE